MRLRPPSTWTTCMRTVNERERAERPDVWHTSILAHWYIISIHTISVIKGFILRLRPLSTYLAILCEAVERERERGR